MIIIFGDFFEIFKDYHVNQIINKIKISSDEKSL
jgi:hypothetical protein